MNTDKTQIFEHDQLPEYHYSNFIGPQQIIIARYKITINAISNRNKKNNIFEINQLRQRACGELNILVMRRGTAATRPRVRMVGKVSNLGDWCGGGW